MKAQILEIEASNCLKISLRFWALEHNFLINSFLIKDMYCANRCFIVNEGHGH